MFKYVLPLLTLKLLLLLLLKLGRGSNLSARTDAAHSRDITLRSHESTHDLCMGFKFRDYGAAVKNHPPSSAHRVMRVH